MRIFVEFDEIRSAIGTEVGASEWIDVPPDGLRVSYRIVIEIEGGQRPACVAELIAMHLR